MAFVYVQSEYEGFTLSLASICRASHSSCQFNRSTSYYLFVWSL